MKFAKKRLLETIEQDSDKEFEKETPVQHQKSIFPDGAYSAFQNRNSKIAY